MERDGKENSLGKPQEEIKQEGTLRHTDSSDENGETVYEKSRRLWKEFEKGRITAQELEQCLAEDDGEVERLKDIFGGKIC